VKLRTITIRELLYIEKLPFHESKAILESNDKPLFKTVFFENVWYDKYPWTLQLHYNDKYPNVLEIRIKNLTCFKLV